MTTVIAKFRCLNITKTWEHNTIVELRPTNGSGDNPENKRFWKYTPSGQLNLTATTASALCAAYEPAAFYYVNCTPVPELAPDDAWKIEELKQTEGRTEVTLRLPWKAGRGWGTLSMSIDNPDAWLPFLTAGVGSLWKVDVTRAPD